MDQQAHRPNGGASAISWLTCLIEVDMLRSPQCHVGLLHWNQLNDGGVRHEAPHDRVEVRDLCRRAVAVAW